MKIIWNLVKIIAGAVIGLLLTKWINVFEYFEFVPKEYKYDICITVYISICELVVGSIADYLLNFIREKLLSTVKVTVYLPQSSPDICHNPEIRFNPEGITEANVEVEYDGLVKHFRETKLIFRHLAVADLQSNISRREVTIQNGDYIINLEELFGGTNIRSSGKYNYKILLSQYPTDSENNVRLEPEIMNKKLCVKFFKNYAQIRTVINNGSNH